MNYEIIITVRGMGNNLPDGAPKKRCCCICYEMQVDSLLYRYVLLSNSDLHFEKFMILDYINNTNLP